jgi:hypothetical protein
LKVIGWWLLSSVVILILADIVKHPLVGMALPIGATGNNGSNITAAQATTKVTYTDLDWKFDGSNDASPWKMGIGSYGLPVFYWQTTSPAAMPTHLQ